MEENKSAVQQIAYPNNSVIISNPANALSFFANECDFGKPIFRISETQIPFNENLIIHDIKTMDRTSEERLLIRNPKYVYNMRRGTGFIAQKDVLDQLRKNPDSKKDQVSYGRRGMTKFFDLLPEYLTESYEIPSIDNRANHIFFPILESFKFGNKVEIFSMRKANGESAQISFSNLANAWVISSKNVSICIRNREDILKYEQYFYNIKIKNRPTIGLEDKFLFSRQIAECWCNEIEKIMKNDPIKYEELKKILDGKTLVGEFVGHSLHQHLITYPDIGLYFFSIADNSQGFTALDPIYSRMIIEKFGLTGVQINSLGIYENIKDLRKKLISHYIEMSQGTIYCEEEGAVLYFVQKSKIPNNDFTLCLCKCKTLEYNIYRIMREILREYCRGTHRKDAYFKGSKKKNPHKDIEASPEKFNKDVVDMVKGWFKGIVPDIDLKKAEKYLPKPLEYYQKMIEKTFVYINKMANKEGFYETTKNKFAEFIENAIIMLDTEYLVNYLQNEIKKRILLIMPPFISIKSLSEYATLSQIIWKNTTNSQIIYLKNIPRFQIEFKKHQEILSKHFIVVFKPEIFQIYSAYNENIEKSESVLPLKEELKLKECIKYQREKIYKESYKNLISLQKIKENGYEKQIYFINIESECEKLIQNLLK